MTALTKDVKRPYRQGHEDDIPIAASTTIYANALVCLDADGYAVPADDAVGYTFAGIAKEYKDNSAGSDGDETVRVMKNNWHEVTVGNAVTQANVGDKVYCVDDDTVDLAANTTNDILAGKITAVIDSTTIWLDPAPAFAA